MLAPENLSLNSFFFCSNSELNVSSWRELLTLSSVRLRLKWNEWTLNLCWECRENSLTICEFCVRATAAALPKIDIARQNGKVTIQSKLLHTSVFVCAWAIGCERVRVYVTTLFAKRMQSACFPINVSLGASCRSNSIKENMRQCRTQTRRQTKRRNRHTVKWWNTHRGSNILDADTHTHTH